LQSIDRDVRRKKAIKHDFNLYVKSEETKDVGLEHGKIKDLTFSKTTA
jgi:hypothetical protein